MVFDQSSETLPGISSPFQAACIPLVHLGATQGVMYLVSIHHRHFLPNEVNILTTIAIYLAALIAENQRFLQHQRLTEEFQLIEQIEHAMQMEMNTDQSLNLFLQDILKVMLADAGAVFLQDPSQGDYYMHAMLGYPESMRDLRLKLGEGIAGWVVAHGRAYTTVNLSSDPYLLPSERELTRNMASTICIPLKVKGKAIGVLHISSRSPRYFTAGEERFLVTIANKIALTIDRTYLCSQMADLAKREATIRKFYEDVIEEMPISAKVIDKDLVILRFNKAMEGLCECNREDAIGRNEFEALPVLATSKESVEMFDTVLRTNQPVGRKHLLVPHFHRSKPETIFDVKFLPLKDVKGEMVNIVLFVQDVTELETLRKKLAMYSPFE
jgi:PAS domain S-box-containing protein